MSTIKGPSRKRKYKVSMKTKLKIPKLANLAIENAVNNDECMLNLESLQDDESVFEPPPKSDPVAPLNDMQTAPLLKQTYNLFPFGRLT
ncbi:12542_t:CDS:2 [Entrophospora sp. SA101]|nr:3953_t:CDS:2 [Entrophospora sp. SA101]CAJ0752914.1 12542_t:CDS:2 [Entrophospora sp. SA101]CAJ0824095.1 1355_t:CDS:2 [Entrophospora sp. SA101]CAJ0824099.1 1357_t:CDS:2 [Entrophospora sp. SA101]CAJ0824103.1 1506_t:CDS:2 [Entrophospora sp. SA101]